MPPMRIGGGVAAERRSCRERRRSLGRNSSMTWSTLRALRARLQVHEHDAPDCSVLPPVPITDNTYSTFGS